METLVANYKTKLSGEDVIARAVQFFSNERWKPSSQSSRTATFEGKPPIPWFRLLFTIMGLFFFVVPGIIMYFLLIKKMNRFWNLVVAANPISGGTEVSISHPKFAATLVNRFISALPTSA